jgi:hypothetical protein
MKCNTRNFGFNEELSALSIGGASWLLGFDS